VDEKLGVNNRECKSALLENCSVVALPVVLIAYTISSGIEACDMNLWQKLNAA
jgi:hypothetical protein